MAVSMLNLNTYSKLFASPVSNVAAPISNLIYGGTVASRYAKRLSDSLSSDMKSFLSSLNSNTLELKSTSKALTGSNSILNAKEAVADSTAVKASASSGASNASYTFSVKQLARAQRNTGTAFYSDSRNTLTSGTNSFKITVNDKESEVSFNVNYSDTNKTTLNNMAAAINDANIGVTAKVVNDDKKGTSRLEIVNDSTGTENSFSITDVEGEAVKRSGISQVTDTAQDAVYVVNGEEHTSRSNTIALDNGKLNVTLNAVTEKEAKITVASDKETVMKGIGAFVEDFNQAITFANSNKQYAISEKLSKELRSIVSSKQGSLGGIGINVNYDGTLDIDEKRLAKTLEEDPGKVSRVLGGFDGAASKVAKETDKTLTTVALSSVGENLYKSDNTSFYSYLRNASKTMFYRNESMGLFVDTLL